MTQVGLIGFFYQLKYKERMGLVSRATHPTSEARLHEMRAAIALQDGYPVRPLNDDWDAIQRNLRD